MKLLYVIGIFVFILVMMGSASADVVLTVANEAHPGNIQINVNYGNGTITFLDQSSGVINSGIAGVGYNLGEDALQITGYMTNSNTGQLLYDSVSKEQNTNKWSQKNNFSAEGEFGNLFRFYEGNTGDNDRFNKVVVKLPSLNGNLPANNEGNQVGAHLVCDQFTGFVAGPGNGGIANKNPALRIMTSALPKNYSSAGQKIEYDYVVTNTGNIPITGLTVTDDKLGIVSKPSSALAPGQAVSVTSVYHITQADIDMGSVTNTGYATGTYNSQEITSNAAAITITADKPSLSLLKSALPETYDAAGQIIKYTYTVTNTGNVKISGPINVIDNHINKGTPFGISQNDIAVGDQFIYTKNYTITNDDLNTGSVTATAYATGTYNNNEITSNTVATKIKAYKSALTIVNSELPTNYSTVGQQIEYKYVVTNTGNMPITGLIVTGDKLGLVSIPTNALTPGQAVSVTSVYQITQADLKSGNVTNTAYATGICNGHDIKSNTDTETVPESTNIPEFPSIVLPVMVILGLILISQTKRK